VAELMAPIIDGWSQIPAEERGKTAATAAL
jgi:hypothetical protein